MSLYRDSPPNLDCELGYFYQPLPFYFGVVAPLPLYLDSSQFSGTDSWN